jgi:hypothetical protein
MRNRAARPRHTHATRVTESGGPSNEAWEMKRGGRDLADRRGLARCRSAAVASLAFLAIAAGHPGGASALETSRYSGTVVGDPTATVSFRVRTSEQGKRRFAAFEYSDVQIFYEDGTAGRHSASQSRFGFKNADTFHDEFSEASVNSSGFYEVKGHLRSGGRARGYLVVVADFYNPPPPGFEPQPDWSTHGRVHWKATRGSDRGSPCDSLSLQAKSSRRTGWGELEPFGAPRSWASGKPPRNATRAREGPRRSSACPGLLLGEASYPHRNEANVIRGDCATDTVLAIELNLAAGRGFGG